MKSEEMHESIATEYDHTCCQLCGKDNHEVVYEGFQEAGPSLGRIPISLLLCNFCGFLYQSPRLSRQQLENYYSAVAGASGSTFHLTGKESRFDSINIRRINFFKSNYQHDNPVDPYQILDVGCSSGDFLASLAAPGIRLFGLEPSRYAVQEARKKGINIIQGELEKHSFPYSEFDVVFCHMVLEHVHDINAAMAALRALLKPSGKLFLEVPDSTRPILQMGEFFSFEHLSHFTLETLTNLLAKHGLKIIDAVADENDPRLRVCAIHSEKLSVVPTRPESIIKTGQLLTKYREKRKILRSQVYKRLDGMAQTWRLQKRRVGIYGAGVHSQDLLESANFRDCICAVLDSDPNKIGTRFLSWVINSPQAFDELSLDVVVISSRAFQDEIYLQLKPHQDQLGFELIKLYE